MIQEVSEPILATVISSGGIAVIVTAISAAVSALVALALWRVSRQTYALNREMQVWRRSQFRPKPVVGEAVLRRISKEAGDFKYRVKFSLYNPGEVPIQVREVFSTTFLLGVLSLEIVRGSLEDPAHSADAWVEPHRTKEFIITAVGKRPSEGNWPDALGLWVSYVTAGESFKMICGWEM